MPTLLSKMFNRDSAQDLARVIADLTSKRDAVIARAAENDAARKASAFEVATGGEAAQRELDRLAAESHDLQLELQNVDLALGEAHRRRDEAERKDTRRRRQAMVDEMRAAMQRRLVAAGDAENAMRALLTALKSMEAEAEIIRENRRELMGPRETNVEISNGQPFGYDRVSVRLGMFAMNIGLLRWIPLPVPPFAVAGRALVEQETEIHKHFDVDEI